MGKILFIPFFIESHFLPSLGVAKALPNKYKIYYALPKVYKGFPILNGFEYVNLDGYPFGIGYEALLNASSPKQSKYLDILEDRFSNRIYRDREAKLDQIVNDIQPSFIFIDILSSTDFIILHKYIHTRKIGIGILSPALSAVKLMDVPSLNSSLNPAKKAGVVLENSKMILTHIMSSFAEFLKYFGKSNKNIISKAIKRNGLAPLFGQVSKNYFAPLFRNVPTVVLAPKEIEFSPHIARRDHFYVGPMIDYSRAEKFNSPEFMKIKNELVKWKQAHACNKIIYVAFGSMHYKWNKEIEDFLKKFTLSVSDQKYYKALVAFDGSADISKEINLPLNVYLFPRVPQLEILKEADLFINHGGLGSVKESLALGVPMLIYPINKKWDSMGNANKIAYYQLGLSGRMRDDSVDIIKKKIISILSDSKYKTSTMKIKKLIDEKYSQIAFLKLFESEIKARVLNL